MTGYLFIQSRHRRLRRLAHSRRSLERRRETPYSSPSSSASAVQKLSTHEANSHDDTTEGAVHYFQDEEGNWHSYTFGNKNNVGRVNPVSCDLLPKLDSLVSKDEQLKLEPQQGIITVKYCVIYRNSVSVIITGSSSSGVGANFSLKVKTPPSSSESWSSASSSELAVDPAYACRRPGDRMIPPLPFFMNNRNSSHNCRCRGIPGLSHCPNHNFSQACSPSGLPSPLPSMPSLATITPEFSTSASASTHAISSRLIPPPTLPLGAMQRSWQRNPRDVLQVLTESFLERRRAPPYHHPQGK